VPFGTAAQRSLAMEKLLQEIVNRLDKLIELFQKSFQPKSLYQKIIDNILTIVGILSIIAIIDIIKSWLGG
jgi:hypothetical protein